MWWSGDRHVTGTGSDFSKLVASPAYKNKGRSLLHEACFLISKVTISSFRALLWPDLLRNGVPGTGSGGRIFQPPEMLSLVWTEPRSLWDHWERRKLRSGLFCYVISAGVCTQSAKLKMSFLMRRNCLQTSDSLHYNMYVLFSTILIWLLLYIWPETMTQGFSL